MAKYKGYIYVLDEINYVLGKESNDVEEAMLWLIKRATTGLGKFYKKIILVDSDDNTVAIFNEGKAVFPDMLVELQEQGRI